MSILYLLNRFTVFGVISLLGTQSVLALSLILPMEAIYESGRLRQDEFKKKYPGIDVSSDIPDEEGYYVRYTHTNLTYYFGPVDDYYTAEDKSFELQEIIDLATFELPYLKSSEIYVWQFSDGMFEDAMSGGQAEGLQVAEIDGNQGSSGGSSQSNEQGTIINTGPMNAAQMAQMREAQESGEMGQMGGPPGQMNQMPGQQQMQEAGGQMSQSQKNMASNQGNQSSQSQQSQSSSGSSGQGGGQGSGGGSSGSSKSQGQEQQQGGGMSIWKMLGRIFGL